MAVIIKSLADTQLVAVSTGNDQTFAYSPSSPPSRMAVVRNIRLANADPTALVSATVLVECKTGTQSRDTVTPPTTPPFRRIAPLNIVIPPNGMFVIEDEVTLDTADQVRITLVKPASGTAKLDVVLSGIERDV